ncbi:hypothetical protein GCM10023201_52090 [Actinomycetospora corticicola]|uniref:Cytochrome bd-type quinol oxidase subunit 2 n=1 Tax=Actinomycetospora corticicola TaxID=663602 RepID=A0A7Y9DXT3_9PSEU|nr:hypothetical protein [Actinomycetospora corticicola]NYD37528.1 cytochrome bd-type quinol oxidase subunit 2 [Actinomycetospora corticicola]
MSTNRSTVSHPPGTTQGSQAARNRRASRRALWWSSGTALGAATIAATVWLADHKDPQTGSWTWTLLLIVLGLIVVAVLRATVGVRADEVAWSAALADLLAQHGQPSEEPADAVLGIEWSLQGLSLADGPRAVGMLPRILGSDGAITVLQAHRRLVIEARSRSW